VGYGEPGCQWGHDQPGKKSADDPIAFPGPASDLFVGYIKGAGSKAADEMENDTKDYLHGLIEFFDMATK
jgi:hypothetical protein